MVGKYRSDVEKAHIHALLSDVSMKEIAEWTGTGYSTIQHLKHQDAATSSYDSQLSPSNLSPYYPERRPLISLWKEKYIM